MGYKSCLPLKPSVPQVRKGRLGQSGGREILEMRQDFYICKKGKAHTHLREIHGTCPKAPVRACGAMLGLPSHYGVPIIWSLVPFYLTTGTLDKD